ncbi:hypothetical protein E4P41_08540 [Geodermatophilus sp. DF01-2]|uniref:hypothetical protein n=1 Tax=Geodermatophilus sp. DF01-2 TaxID=2559610 RepID=UPI001073FE7A|nr:hypothetical protein [Geodermatophilus sp. DF01_2]TFV62038.1 hypothetical protein E4P41_08540 [Geodermatophilus sp. DF01_2]
MTLILVILGVLVIGVFVGLWARGALLARDRRALDNVRRQLIAEQRMRTQTHDTIRAMRTTARRYEQRPGSGGHR